ncbi:MAG TPA: hypothetical protein VFR35_07805 [Actinoplanes sp.]|nr:hypothetical protein [Actinoplanes sp.]
MVSLTGTPLIVLTCLGTVVSLLVTLVWWQRGGRLPLLRRLCGVLLTEALLMATVGLAVNRAQLFYPTWADLTAAGRTHATTYPVAAGHLDRWLAAQPADRTGADSIFTWHPTGWTDWRLASPPTVVTPPGYLGHPGWRYSVVVVADDRGTSWSPATEESAARSAEHAAGPVVLVFLTTSPATPAATLASRLPDALSGALRVTAHRWAVVASPTTAAVAERAVLLAPGRYPIMAVAEPATAPPAITRISPAGPAAHRQVPGGRVPSLPAGVTTAVAGWAPGVVAGQAERLTATGADVLGAALVWACLQTPPPLAPSAPTATRLPSQPPSTRTD